MRSNNKNNSTEGKNTTSRPDPSENLFNADDREYSTSNTSTHTTNEKAKGQSQTLTRIIYTTLFALSIVVIVLLYLQYKTSKELASLSQNSSLISQVQLLDSPPVTSNIIFQAVKGVLMDLGGNNNDIVISKLDASQTPPVVWVDITLRGGSTNGDTEEAELRHTFITNVETLLLPTGVTIEDKGFQIDVRGPEYTIILLLKNNTGGIVPHDNTGDIGEYSNITDDIFTDATPTNTTTNITANEELSTAYQEFAQSLTPAPPAGKSLVFVIDDCGYSDNLTTRVTNINRNLTVAVIPFLRHSVSSAEIARNNGNPVFLHLPMEPYHNAPIMNDLQNRLLVNMTADEWTHLATISAENVGGIDGIGGIDGFNNHEGSYFTEGVDRMSTVLQAMAPFTNLFLDSRTSSKSVGYSTCKGIQGYNCASNNWYLDNNNDYAYIFNQTLGLTKSKRKDTVVIAHCRPKTVDALELAIPLLVENGYSMGTVPLVSKPATTLPDSGMSSGMSNSMSSNDNSNDNNNDNSN